VSFLLVLVERIEAIETLQLLPNDALIARDFRDSL
jgi:hypothetical protein